jgi:hypothetical protein
MARGRLALIVVGALAAVLLATVATADPATVVERSPDLGWATPDVETPVDEPEGFVPNEPEPIAPAEAIDVADATETMTLWFQILAFAAIALAALFMARNVWQQRPEQRSATDDSRGDFVTLAEVADTIVADAEAHRAALGEGSPRNGIVACWLRLEDSVERAGVERDPTITSTELTAEVLQRFEIDPAAVERLGALFREARFSTHELDDGDRTAAIAALDEVHEGLRRTARRSAARS